MSQRIDQSREQIVGRYRFIGGPSDGETAAFVGRWIGEPDSGFAYVWRDWESRYVWTPIRKCSGCGARIEVARDVACPLCGAEMVR